MAILTVPGSELDINTPASSVKLDEGALNARYRGQRALAAAAENIGGAAEGLMNDLAKVKMAGITADADFRMRAAQHSFDQSTVGDKHYDQWSARAQQTAQKVKEDIYAAHSIPPALRPQLEASLRNWGQTLNIKAQVMAADEGIKWATQKVRNAYDESGRDGDPFGMANAVLLGKRSHLDPVEMEQMEHDIPKTLALTAIENGLRTNPKGTHDLLASGGSLPIEDQHGNAIIPKKVFSQKEFQGLVNSAQTQTTKWQTANFESMLGNDADPVTGMVPDNVIRGKMASGEISERAGLARISGQDAKLKAATKEQQAELLRDDRQQTMLLDARMSDPTNWGDPPNTFAAEVIADAGKINNDALRSKVIADAHKHVASITKRGQLDEKPVESQVMSLMREDREQNGAFIPVGEKTTTTGMLWWKQSTTAAVHFAGGVSALRKDLLNSTKAQIEGLYGKGATSQSVLNAEQDAFSHSYDQMRQWFKTPEGQKATLEQANDMRRRIEEPYRAGVAATALNHAMTTNSPVFSAQDLDAWHWAQGHQGDPMSSQIYEKIMKKYPTFTGKPDGSINR